MGNQVKGHLYFIFSIILESTLVHPVSQNALKSWWQQPLEKTWAFNAKTEQWLIPTGKPRISKNMHFLHDLSKLMFRISNLFAHLIGKTRFQKHIDDFIYTLLIYFFLYTILIVIPNKFI